MRLGGRRLTQRLRVVGRGKFLVSKEGEVHLTEDPAADLPALF